MQLFLASLSLIVLGLMYLFYRMTLRYMQSIQANWQEERKQFLAQIDRMAKQVEELLNRCMAKDLAAYQQIVMMNPSRLQENAEDLVRGLSDDEELRRAGLGMIGENGLGDVLVDTEREAEELGFKTRGN